MATTQTTTADLHRLAEQGQRNGITLLMEAATGARFATSASEPGTIYYLTGNSCTCRGFAYHQRCQHHALLLATLGWLPDLDPEPTTPAPAGYPGLTSAEVVALKADAMKRHALHGEPLVSPFTGEVIAPAWYQDPEERAGDVDEDGRWVWDDAA